jgi:hypothetical protein
MSLFVWNRPFELKDGYAYIVCTSAVNIDKLTLVTPREFLLFTLGHNDRSEVNRPSRIGMRQRPPSAHPTRRTHLEYTTDSTVTPTEATLRLAHGPIG